MFPLFCPLPITSLFFLPQVTKKRVSGRKMQETREFVNSAYVASSSPGTDTVPLAQAGPPPPASPQTPPVSPQDCAEKTTPSTPKTPKQNPNPHTPGSASKRKHRKLAVNFEAAKVTQWKPWTGAVVFFNRCCFWRGPCLFFLLFYHGCKKDLLFWS